MEIAGAVIRDSLLISSPSFEEDLVIPFSKEADPSKVPKGSRELKIFKEWKFKAILGSIELLLGRYLIVVSKAERLGEIHQHSIFRALTCDAIPLFEVEPTFKTHIDSESLELIDGIVSSGFLYFSETFNLSQSIQKQLTHGTFGKKPLHQHAEDNFFWNKSLAEPFLSQGLGDYIIPMIYGHVSYRSLLVKGQAVDFLLISRRNRKRAGFRYTKRGADHNGNTANFVETEQIVIKNEKVSSFLQTRGSIPILWKQVVDLNYKPSLLIQDSLAENTKVMKIHLDHQIARYGDIMLVNLISQKGFERPLNEAFSESVSELNSERVKYIEFSVNEMCKNMKYDKISLLIDQLRPYLKEHGFFVWNGKGDQHPRLQKGICRTNCLDCLDRTNLTQSFIALEMLPAQLEQIGVLNAAEINVSGQGLNFKFDHQFMHNFRNIWADNGDDVSIQYAGTGALKADYTRTGKRRIAGGIADGKNSLSRYYINNFVDGRRQDALDLFLGRKRVSIIEEKPKEEPLQQSQLWYVSLLMLLLTFLAPRQVRSNFEFLQAVLWSIFMVFAWKLFNLDGRALTVAPAVPDEVEITLVRNVKKKKKEY